MQAAHVRSQSARTRFGSKEVANFAEVRSWLAANVSACLVNQFDDPHGGVCDRCPFPPAWQDLHCKQAAEDTRDLRTTSSRSIPFTDLSRRRCGGEGGGTYFDDLLKAGGGERWPWPGAGSEKSGRRGYGYL